MGAVQPLLRPQAYEVAGVLRPRRRDRGGRRGCVPAEPLERRAPRGERLRDGLLVGAGEARLLDEAPIELRRAVDRVEAGERVVERLGAEQNRERIGLALLVEHA